MLNVYQYDQLNRLKASRSFETGLTNNVWNPTSYANAYLNTFNYDANGNITSQVRHKRDGTKLDDLTYNYQKDGATTPNLISNRLYHVNDVVASTVDLTDIDNQGSFVTGSAINQSNNYIYDQEGRLIRDKQEKITIKWRNDGKIKEIVRDASETLKKTITFEYDAMGNRIAKHVKTAAGVLEKSTYYILDAQGNQLAMYEHLATVSPATYTLKERNIYGSSLLGVNRFEQNMFAATAPTTPQAVNLKHYTISNHLGNVLTVFSDKKVPILSGTTVIGYNPTIVSNSDYSPFGVELDGRTSVGSYRYGFNGMEADDEAKGDGNSYNFGARMYDSRLGRWLSRDALEAKYPDFSSYSLSLNNPVIGKDVDGNVIIFINGQHDGGGGKSSYWGGYDLDVSKTIGDKSLRYVDGSLGGFKNTNTWAAIGFSIGGIKGAYLSVINYSNVNRNVRINAGKVQGMNDAKDIIANLKNGETIKIVTHSMGTAFARGYTKGIIKYAKKHGLMDKVKFEYELDVNSFQGANLPADPNVKITQNKTGGLDGGESFMEALKGNSVPTVDKVPGAKDITDMSDANKGHEIKEMSTSKIPHLGNGGAKQKIEQGNNNEKAQ